MKWSRFSKFKNNAPYPIFVFTGMILLTVLFRGELKSQPPNNNFIHFVAIDTDSLNSEGSVAGYLHNWDLIREYPNGSEKIIANWHDLIEISIQDELSVLKRTQKVEFKAHMKRENTTLINLVNADTMLRIHTLLISTDTDFNRWEIVYNKFEILGHRPFAIEGDSEQPFKFANYSASRIEPVNDWNLWGLLVAGLSLKDDYKARLKGFMSKPSATGSPFKFITTEVIGSSVIESAIWGRIECWMVDVQANHTWRLWLSKNETAAPIQQFRIVHPEGGYIWWKLKKEI